MPFYYGSSLFPPFGDSDSNIFGPGGPGSKPPTPPPPSSGSGGSIFDPPSLPGGGGDSNIWHGGGPFSGPPASNAPHSSSGGGSGSNIWGPEKPGSGVTRPTTPGGSGDIDIAGPITDNPMLRPGWNQIEIEEPSGINWRRNHLPGPLDPKSGPPSVRSPQSNVPTGVYRPAPPPPAPDPAHVPTGKFSKIQRFKPPPGSILRGIGRVGGILGAAGGVAVGLKIFGCADVSRVLNGLADSANQKARANNTLASAARDKLNQLVGGDGGLPQGCMAALEGLLQEMAFLQQQMQLAQQAAQEAAGQVQNALCSELVNPIGVPTQQSEDARQTLIDMNAQIDSLGEALDDALARMNATLEACGLKAPRRPQRRFRFELAFSDGRQ